MCPISEIFPSNLDLTGKAEVEQLAVWLLKLGGDDGAVNIPIELGVLLLMQSCYGSLVHLSTVLPDVTMIEVIEFLIHTIPKITSEQIEIMKM